MCEKDALLQALDDLKSTPDRMADILLEQADRIAELTGQVEKLTAENKDLRDQIRKSNDRDNDLRKRMDEVERIAHRQAAPFRRPEEKRAKERKRSGRKKGHKGAYRSRPDRIDETVEAPLDRCPHCGGAPGTCRPIEQFVEDLPETRPHVTKVVTYEITCAACGKKSRSNHPLQVSKARGAAATHLGPRALGLAALLNKSFGATMRKTCKILNHLGGLRLTPGGLSQALARTAGKLAPAYAKLIESLRSSGAVHADETSWWVGGPGHWLWVFTHPKATVYRVDSRRGRDVIHEILGTDFAGVLVSDCLASYDDATSLQQKCYSHHLKAVSQAVKRHPHGGEGYLREVRALLNAAMILPELDVDDDERSEMRKALGERAIALLVTDPRKDIEEERVRNRLFKQIDHLFTFLDHPGVDATNNLAERQLRPAVIARKVSCGNKTDAGARTLEILTSLTATCHQRGESFLDLVDGVIRPPPNPA